ncbi:HlyD family type I secretion periplasmic adaptor subunit [Mesorhizobium sp.]|uniref:HlyD family type I secretion periplasmic adaptor subunit n=1 Tax=Mesorhizobium sp. TaxID=1871066 RepID=UPI000FE391F7|nr:HlyD family type I secretion periplasmic adaptor subunit [Mesorhizobium sp.]RWB96842.1 MAG: HlyD family type I secretion periplasmic adaptor subunit [Mesorhizobium sp.]RWO98494.1 MAG: HlyD family type I secretion periplasmic adaptor subunit [Mesorhizobium sp.]RWP26192.1 MAG: HlyD family type I secretion periplasmic adaptor subunit [Mesorhizobium sp.]RWP59957.1 MAG: HlyD family type I secretion periplasmic adaptor subunit [Mesorhizobium sp.]RWQ15949.1 MAG: HlyD family type I secretion peripl
MTLFHDRSYFGARNGVRGMIPHIRAGASHLAGVKGKIGGLLFVRTNLPTDVRSQPTQNDLSLRRYMLLGAATVALLVGGLGAWAATTELSGAVIATGHIAVESNVKAVQHPSGGVVGEINVRNGDEVRAGDILLRLDDTLTRANLAVITNTLDELSAREARLTAEREGAEAIAFSEDLTSRSSVGHVARVIGGEQKLFALRRGAYRAQIEQRRQRVSQLKEEIAGLEAQRAAKEHEIALVRDEIKGVRGLWEKKLVQRSRLLDLERGEAQIEGGRGQLVAAIAEANGRISETEMAIIQIQQDWRSEVAKELRETEARTTELAERKIAAEELLRQTDIRSPQNGRVHQLAIHTVGGVVTTGEPIMMIVPTADELTVDARIAPQDIDQVQPGQLVHLRLSAFSQQVTPEIEGHVATVSPDLVEDERNGLSYYSVRIRLDEGKLGSLDPESLKPGMPVEAFMRTTDRTVISFLMKPLTDQISRAFRE